MHAAVAVPGRAKVLYRHTEHVMNMPKTLHDEHGMRSSTGEMLAGHGT